MPLNHFVTLGGSGLAVSPMCLGTMTFGKEWGWGDDADVSTRVLQHYIERGGNFVDTANVYNHGHSEKIIGDFLHKNPTIRRQMVIATKFCNNLYPGNPNTGGASRISIIGSCENSLRRLQTDYIDLYWMHHWDSYTPMEESLRALDDLASSGKVRYIGFSNVPAWKTAEAQTIVQFRGWTPIIAIQIEYSLLERTVESELVPMARAMQMGIVPWSPLKFGMLSGKYTSENIGKVESGRSAMVSQLMNDNAIRILEVVRRVAHESGTTPARVALSWLRSRQGVASIIIGARNDAQLDDNIGALELELSREQLGALDAVSKPVLSFPADFLDVVANFARGGATLNGRKFEAIQPFLPTNDAPAY